jgi:hypothetical protein
MPFDRILLKESTHFPLSSESAYETVLSIELYKHSRAIFNQIIRYGQSYIDIAKTTVTIVIFDDGEHRMNVTEETKQNIFGQQG